LKVYFRSEDIAPCILDLGPMTGFSTVTMLQFTRQFLAQTLITGMEYPSYSPDLALNDFWLFPKLSLL
jgi:hypothetical protein